MNRRQSSSDEHRAAFGVDCSGALLLLLLAASPSLAQLPPPIHQITRAEGELADTLGPAAALRVQRDGSVLINDFANRRLLMADAALAHVRVVADSSVASGGAYSAKLGGLIPFTGDSTLLVDLSALAMTVVSGRGVIGRTIAVPRASDAAALVSLTETPVVDPKARIVYRSNLSPAPRQSATAGQAGLPAPSPDSAPILRVSMSDRSLDTVAYIKTPSTTYRVVVEERARVVTPEINPLPTVDAWAVQPDGTVTVLRGHDYHLDFYAPDGSKRSGPKLPFQWRRLDDAIKTAVLDSVRAKRASAAAARSAAMAANGQRGALTSSGRGEGVTYSSEREVPKRGASAVEEPPVVFAPSELVPIERLPDYAPAFFAGAMRADLSGNLWIQTTTDGPAPGGLVYDVVDPGGRLIERVQLPPGRVLAGVGARGEIYMSARPGASSMRTVLERAVRP